MSDPSDQNYCYNEAARKAMGFAHNLAGNPPYLQGENQVQSYQLLIGLLQEEVGLVGHVLPPEISVESVTKLMTCFAEREGEVSRKPGSYEYILARASEIAEALGKRQVGAELLLLGILREPSSLGAELLKHLGITLDTLRIRVGYASIPL